MVGFIEVNKIPEIPEDVEIFEIPGTAPGRCRFPG